ncbi:MAG: hypothetical protein IJP34_01430 [Clostridia bacterium]|nr:hypothetical protein [Clostridia bacterium]
MKKVLAILLTVVLAVSAFTTTAFAATTISPEKTEGIITEATGTDANGTSWELQVVDTDESTDAYEKEIGNNEKIADHKKIILKGSGNPKYPIDVTFTANGIKATNEGYILFKGADGKIVKIEATMGNGTIKAKFPSLGNFVLVLKEKAGSTEPPKSDPTSDNFTPIAFTLLLAGIAVSLVSIKKIRSAA